MSLLDPVAPRQLQHQRFVERGLGREVEGVETLDLRKARKTDAALDITSLAINPLQLAQAEQIARVIGEEKI